MPLWAYAILAVAFLICAALGVRRGRKRVAQMREPYDGPTMTVEDASRVLGMPQRNVAMLLARGELAGAPGGVLRARSVEAWRAKRDTEGPFGHFFRSMRAILRWMP
jgi:hypothetical protein